MLKKSLTDIDKSHGKELELDPHIHDVRIKITYRHLAM